MVILIWQIFFNCYTTVDHHQYCFKIALWKYVSACGDPWPIRQTKGRQFPSMCCSQQTLLSGELYSYIQTIYLTEGKTFIISESFSLMKFFAQII